MKVVFTLVVLLTASFSYSQKIYSSARSTGRDVTVFEVKYETQADLKVYKASYETEAGKNDGIWYFVKYETQADKKVYFTSHETQADLKVYFVNYKTHSGWLNEKKKHLMN